MKRILKLSTLILTVILVGCAARPQGALPARSIYTIPSVNGIEMNGGSNLAIELGSSLNRATSYGAPLELDKSRSGILEIASFYSDATPSNVLLQVQRISQMNFSNIQNLTIKSKYRQTITLSLKNLGRVKVSGPLNISRLDSKNVSKLILGKQVHVNKLNAVSSSIHALSDRVANPTINQSGSKKTDIVFINALDVTVNGTDNSVTKLGGSAKKLTANLDDSAVLDATFLRANKVHVKTNDNAHAKVYANNDLFAEADGTSRIDYFGLPKYNYKLNHGEGIILPGEPPNEITKFTK